MNSSQALAAEQAVALTAGIARDLIGQGEAKGLPKPRFLVAVFAFYGALGLLSGFGTTAARFAVAAGGVAALTTLVVGPGGLAVVGFLRNLTGLATSAPSAPPDLGPSGSAATSGAGTAAGKAATAAQGRARGAGMSAGQIAQGAQAALEGIL